MDITPLTGRLDELMSNVRFEGEGGRVLVPERPVDLDPLVLPLYPDYDPDEWDPLWVGFGDDAEVATAFRLEWLSMGPMAWDAPADYLAHQDRAYVLIPPDEGIGQEWQAMALIEPADCTAAWDVFVEDLLCSAGRNYGIEVFGSSWPSGVEIYLPDLIHHEAIDRARERWTAASGGEG